MKKLLWTVGVLLVLLVAGVLVGPSLVDWNQYKGDIQAQAKNATGRALTINGDIKITVLPSPALIASEVTLANVKGATAKNMVALKHLEIRIAMAPLLAGRIEVERIKLVDPVIELEVLADGSNNWTFEALESATGTPPGQRGITGRRGGAVSGPEVALDNFTIENGTVVYRDAKGGVFERVEKINASIAAASLNGPFESTGGFRLRGLPLNYGVNVGEIIHGRTVPFNLRLGVQPAGLNMQLVGTVVGLEDAPKIKGKIKGKSESLARLIQAVKPESTLPRLFGQAFSFEGAVVATTKSGGLKGLSINIGNTQVTGDITVETGKVPTVTAGLSAKRIDLDTWLALPPVTMPVAVKRETGAPAPKTPSSGGAAVTVAAPFSLPKNVNGSLAFTAEAVTFKGGIIRNAVLNVELTNGEVTVSQLSAQFPGGSNLAVFGFVTTPGGAPRFEGELESTVNDLRVVLDWLGGDIDGIQPDRLRKLTLATRVVALPEQIQLTGLDLQFDSSRLTGGVAVAFSKRLSFGADLKIDRLNLDAYLPKPAIKAAAKEKKDATPGAPAGNGKAGKGEISFTPLKALTGMDANLKVRIGTLFFRGIRVKDVTFDGTLYNGKLDIRRLSVARMAGTEAVVSGALKGFDGIPEAEALTFNVKAGDVPGFLRFLGQDPGMVPKGLGPVTVSGRIDGKLLAPKLNIKMTGAGATARLSGRIEELGLIPAVKGLKFQLAAADASGLLRLAGLDTPGAAKQLGAVSITGSLDGNLLKPDLMLNLKAAGGSVALSGTLNMLHMLPIGDLADLGLKATFPDATRLLRALGAGYRPSGKIGALDLQARLRINPDTVKISGMDAKIGATQVKGDVVVGLGGPRPNIKADLTSTAIVIDPFMPAGKSASLWGDAKILPAAWPGSLKMLPNPMLKLAAARGAAKGRWPNDPIDLSGLAAVDGAITFKSPLVQFEKYKLVNTDLAVKMAKGKITADKLTGVLFGGALHATGSVTAAKRPRIETAFALENMNIGQALRAFAGSTIASGRMSLKARLQTSGRSVADMISGLNGSGSLRMKGIDVKQGKTGTAMAGALGLVTAFNQIGGLLGGGGKGSGVVDISGSFDITGGIARSQDMRVVAGIGNGVATGSVDLPRWRIDVKGHVQLAQNLLTALQASRTRRNITQAVPFTVRGRLDAPTINLDTSKLGGGLPIPGADKLLEKAPKGSGNILQGILGGRTQPPPAETQPPPTAETQPQQQPQRKITPKEMLKELFKQDLLKELFKR